MTITSIVKTNETPAAQYERWREEVMMSEKALEDFWERGEKIRKRFIDDRDALEENTRKFNLFTTNVGIMQSALYSKIPKVSVERRFKDMDDDIARVASNIMYRAITQDLDVPDCYFSQIMTECIEDRLVPGFGQAWARLQTDTEQPEDVVDPATGELTTPPPQIVSQTVIFEHVHWKDFLWSPCRTWAERRWVGRRVYMDRDSLVARFGEEVGRQLPLDYAPKKGNQDDKTEILQKAIVYEIWDRQTRSVIWLSKAHPELLDHRDDPLKLEDFEPCPKPLFALTTTSSCIPTADYYLIQDQYKELDQVNNRISLLNEALKVVGVYDRASDGVQRMLGEAVENQLVPVDNWAMFAEKGGIKGAVDWLPIEQVAVVLERLRTAREDIKGQIYELTGISDIVRGATKASETLGAQQIKAQFASIRIQQLQDSVANFAAALFRIKAQILAKHFTPEQLLKVSTIEFTVDAKTNPQLVGQALQLIKNEQEFMWRVSVDADSMKMADYAAEKQERAEFITSLATYLQSAATMVKAEPGATPLLISMLKYATAAQKGAKEMEGIIDATLEAWQAQQQEPKPDPEQQAAERKMQLEQQKQEMKMAADQQKAQMDARAQQQEMLFQQSMNAMEVQHQKQLNDMELWMKRMTLAMDSQKQQMDMVFKQQEQSAKPAEKEEPQETGPKVVSINRGVDGKIAGATAQ
jgi:hypothetical protein